MIIVNRIQKCHKINNSLYLKELIGPVNLKKDLQARE
jgi:hypothetical protein